MCIEPERTCGDSKLSDKEKKKTRVVLGTTQLFIKKEVRNVKHSPQEN